VAGPPRSSIGTSGRGEPTGRPARDASARTFEHDVELEDLRFAATRELRACADTVTPVSSGRSLSLPHHALAGGRGMLPWRERLHCGRGQRAFASV
jgi:hypothetical protein